MIARTHQDFAPREIFVPANPNVGALAARSETLFRTNPSPIDRSKRKKRKKRRQSRFFGRVQVQNNDNRRVDATDNAARNNRSEVPKVIRFPSVSFCRDTNRKIYNQKPKRSSNIPRNISVEIDQEQPLAIQDLPGKPSPSEVTPRFSNATSRFRFVSFRRGTSRKSNRRTRTKRPILSMSGRKQSVTKQESEAANIMARIISGARKSENSGNPCEGKNGMCRPYKYCYCEECFDADLDWEFQESSELDHSGRHNHVWESRKYSPRSGSRKNE